DLEAPGQAKNILEYTRFNLRDVDRLLHLDHAGLYAVVADAMACARAEGIVDDTQGSDRQPVALEYIHLRDLFLERAARERNAEGALFKRAGFVFQARRT